MSPATLAPPEVDTPPIAAAAAAVPPLPMRAPLRAGRGRERPRVTRAGLAASVVLHLLIAIVLIAGVDQVVRRDEAIRAARQAPEPVTYVDVGQWPTSASSAGATTAVPAPGSAAAAARAVTAAAIDSAIAQTHADLQHFPTRIPTRLPPAPAATPGPPSSSPSPNPAAQPGANGAAADPNAIGSDAAGGRYGPGYRDRRLIVTPEAVPERQKTDHERYMDHLSSVLNGMNDSAAAEAEHQRRLHNWTVKDKNGREWGIGQGGVPIIAGHKIPVPLAPPIYMGRDNEDAERRRNTEHADIQRQADDGERSRSVHESIQNARRHADDERRKRHEHSGDGASQGSPTPPPASSPPSPSGSGS